MDRRFRAVNEGTYFSWLWGISGRWISGFGLDFVEEMGYFGSLGF